MSKFRTGDVVNVVDSTTQRTKKCIVEEVAPDDEAGNHIYHVAEYDSPYSGYYPCEESTMRFLEHDTKWEEYYTESINRYRKRQSFQVGDVVNTYDDPDRFYVVTESILVDDASPRYMYEVRPVSNVDANHIISETSSLIFQYHDSAWEEYFTEGTRQNGLPAWRGNPYNFYMFMIIDNTSGKERVDLDWRAMSDYNDDTIPPMYMKHILDEHSIYERMNAVMYNGNESKVEQNRDELSKTLNMTDEELNKMRNDISDVIFARNKNDLDPNYAKRKKVGSKGIYDFTPEQLKFIREIDRLDYKDKNTEEDRIKDHYPVLMTNLQIMKAIQEAYSNARKVGKRQMGLMKDKRTGEKVVLTRGKVLYEGVSKGGLIIQFWYNFDLDLIETAYPVKMNDNAKKHHPHTESVDDHDGEEQKPVTESATPKASDTVSQSSKRKFQVGNRIHVIRGFGLDGVGVITEARGEGEYAEYTVMLDGESMERVYYNKNLELIAESAYTENADGGPAFQAGDVAYVIDTPNKTNVVIKRVSHMNESTGEYVYDVALKYDGSKLRVNESGLGYLYHDGSFKRH